VGGAGRIESCKVGLLCPADRRGGRGGIGSGDRLDTARMTSDDLVMGNIIAHRADHGLRRIHVAPRLAGVAALEQRLRVARDLRDGAFHSLTEVALELEPFEGWYGHPALAAGDLGPATLEERTALPGGAVSIDASDRGTRPETTVPVGLSGR